MLNLKIEGNASIYIVYLPMLFVLFNLRNRYTLGIDKDSSDTSR